MFDNQLHDYWEPPDTPAARGLLSGIADARRRENQAAAAVLRQLLSLFEMRRRQCGEHPDWAVDTWAAVGAEVAAMLRVGLGKASGMLGHALAMQRLPAVAALFEVGDIDLHTFRTIAFRTGLITDEAAGAEADRCIAARAARWPSMSHGRMVGEIDRIIAAVDPDAVRRAKERVRDRDVTIWDAQDGSADVSARLFATDATALDKRLDALAATVCPADPRTAAQRRADSLGALAAGADRLMCRCGTPACPAAASTASAVVIHVVADQGALDGTSERPGHVLDSGALIPAELLREIAAAARIRPLLAPAAAAETDGVGYRPSAALAAFVRARDLTCRAPGCDRPATACDLDHTVPWGLGGTTCASNIKALCRFHHVMKTFWGWRDYQLSDGTVIWQLPDGGTYVTLPGSALLFPSLVRPTGIPLGRPRSAQDVCGERTAMMPRRSRTRAQSRAHAIARERAQNRHWRQARRTAQSAALGGAGPAGPDEDPPPF